MHKVYDDVLESTPDDDHARIPSGRLLNV